MDREPVIVRRNSSDGFVSIPHKSDEKREEMRVRTVVRRYGKYETAEEIRRRKAFQNPSRGSAPISAEDSDYPREGNGFTVR